MLRERVGCVVETCDVRVLCVLAGERRAGGSRKGVWWRRRLKDLRSVWLCCVLGLAARVLPRYVTD